MTRRARSLMDRLLLARDRLLANPRFQIKAASLPITRYIARRRARNLFDLCAGFVYSQILYTCVRLRLFDLLLDAPQTVAEISAQCGLTDNACERLLMAAVSLNLIEKRSQDRYGLSSLGAALANNTSLTRMIEHHVNLYRDLSDPISLLRQGSDRTNLSTYWPYATSSDPASLSADQVAQYSALMTDSQPLVAAEVLDAYPVSNHQVLLDVGGGEGAFLDAAAERAPSLHLKLFDLPAVVTRAEASPHQRPIDISSGDFFNDPLPTGADLITLIRIALDHDDAKVLKLLRSIRTALEPGGTLLVAEPMSDPTSGEKIGAAYFGFYLLAMGHGRPRTQLELTALCHAAGFQTVRFKRGRGALGTGILIARS
jgi:demethylspheroidene O-methyltransferase